MASTVLAPQPSARALSAQGGPYAASSQHLGPYPDSSSSTFNLSTSYSFTSISGTSPSSSSGYRHSPDGGSGSVGGPSFSGAAYEPSTHPSSSAATSSSSLSSLPRQLRPRILSETSHQLSSRTPSPLSSPQLRFDPTEPTEPSGYHGETQFGYDFLPAVQPQLFVAPSTHPFASGVQQVHAYPSSTPSSSSSAEYAYGPHASTSTSAQEYRVTQNGQGSEPRFNADGHSEEGYRQDSRVSPGGFDGYSGGSTLVDHTRAINHERTYAGEGWNASGDVRQGGHEDMPWDNSGGEDDDDDDRGDLSMERRGSTEGERGEVSRDAHQTNEATGPADLCPPPLPSPSPLMRFACLRRSSRDVGRRELSSSRSRPCSCGRPSRRRLTARTWASSSTCPPGRSRSGSKTGQPLPLIARPLSFASPF